jgi:hypothetical protein
MIGVKFNGRMGNQIFQYAFFQYLKTNNEKQVFFFVNPHHAYLTKYFDLDSSQNLLLGSKLYSIFTRSAAVVLPFKELYILNIQVPRAVLVKNWMIYKGFFQTDWYLNQIKGKFNISIKPKYVQAFETKYGFIFGTEKTVVVHIRRTDYMNYGKRDISLPMEYFEARLDAIKDLNTYKVFFVSDDIVYAKAYFKEKPNYIYASNNEIIDFQLIKNADIAIISNSSFAWWAAYLSEKNNTVYAPKNWLGFRIGKEHPKKVMTDKFIWCDVLDSK